MSPRDRRLLKRGFRTATVGCVSSMFFCIFFHITIAPNPNMTPFMWLMAVLGVISAGFDYLLGDTTSG